MAGLTALLDANVLYTAGLRDFLLHLADRYMYAPLWGADIHAEWMRNLLIDRPDIDPGVLERTRAVMDRHFPEAVVKGYETLVATLTGEGRRGHTLAPATEAGDEILARLDCAAGSASGVDLTVSPYALSHGRDR